MLTRSNVFTLGGIPHLCMACPEPNAGAGFDPGLLPELLEHGLIDPLEPNELQWQLIKKLTAQRQRLNACLQPRRRGDQSHPGRFDEFKMEMQKVIELEYELYDSFSLKQKRIARQLLKNKGIL